VECTACHTCVDACPKGQTLTFAVGRRRVAPWVVAGVLVSIFVVAVGGARLAGRWQSSVPPEEYAARILTIDQVGHDMPGRPAVAHPPAGQ